MTFLAVIQGMRTYEKNISNASQKIQNASQSANQQTYNNDNIGSFNLVKLKQASFYLIIFCLAHVQTVDGCSCAGASATWNIQGVDRVDCSSGICTPGCAVILRPYPGGATMAECQPIVCHIPNCAICSSSSTCQSCFGGFWLSSPTACSLPCDSTHGIGCNICDPTNTNMNCQSCLSVYGLNTTTVPHRCFLCNTINAECTTCDQSSCLTCAAGYVRDLSTTQKICVQNNTITGCSLASDGPQCTSCQPGLIARDPYSCQTCIQAYGSTCLTCDNLACLTCQTGLAIFNSQIECITCTDLHPSCLTCNNGPVCTFCDNEFYLNIFDPNSICVPCNYIHNCIACNDGPECLQCDTNYIYDRTGPGNQCLKCAPSQHSTPMNLCQPCPQYCTACYQSGSDIICTSCETGSALDSINLTCKKCNTLLNKCTFCSSLTICTLCEFPYLVGNTSICDICEADFEPLDSFCTNVPGCQSFSIDGSECLLCSAKYHFFYQPKNKTCNCIEGHYLQNLSGFHQCVSKCGDGIFVSDDEDCDDGNLRNQDGCSDQCQQETGFSCTSQSPSQCTLQYTPSEFYFNYAYRYEGENRCKFSLYLTPSHPSFKYVDWSKYFVFNISEEKIVKNSKRFIYSELTNEINVQMEYLSTLEAMSVELILLSSQDSANLKKSTTFIDLSIPKNLSMVVSINGVNAKLIYEEQAILLAYRSASITSLVISILILVQFVIGSYFNKMIGLETIQILQFFFFVRVIIEQNFSSFLNTMNVFKFVAYGGFSDYKRIYGNQAQSVRSLTFMTVSYNFVQVGLMKYFSINVNISLIITVLILIVFIVYLARKSFIRNTYMKKFEQAVKDQYTVLRRSCQWVYDHFVFPYINVFSMIAFFSTILYLNSQSKSNGIQIKDPSVIQLIEISSFCPHLIILFLTFSIFCSEIFQSNQEYKHSKLTESQKARVPKSIIEKLEHDENNPDRHNYKPGYVLFYLTFYFVVQVTLMINILLEPLKDYGVEIMLCLSLVYLIFVWAWNPYISAVNFHNKVLRFNHFVVLIFMVISVIYKRVGMMIALYVAFIYITLLLLFIVAILGYLRIFVEYQFRKQLEDNPSIMEDRSSRKGNQCDQLKNSSDIKKALLRNNNFWFDNQARAILKLEIFSGQNQAQLTEGQIEEAKLRIKQQIELNEREKWIMKREHNFSKYKQLFDDIGWPFDQEKMEITNQNKGQQMLKRGELMFKNDKGRKMVEKI